MTRCQKCGQIIKGSSNRYLLSERSRAWSEHDKVCKGEPPLFGVGAKPRLFGMGMSKTAFVKACVKVLDSHYHASRAGESWIRERVSESGNEKELELARAHPEMILVFADTYGTERVLAGVYTLEGIEIELEAKGIKT